MKTILLIDDEPDLTEVMSNMLSLVCDKVLVASNAVDAMKIAQQNIDKIDLVIMDLVYPGANEDVYKGIASMFPTIIFSGFIGKCNANLNVKSCIEKPFFQKLVKEALKVLKGDES